MGGGEVLWKSKEGSSRVIHNFYPMIGKANGKAREIGITFWTSRLSFFVDSHEYLQGAKGGVGSEIRRKLFE